ncbi:MAG TPA: YfhO family protein [Thermoleophilaceae bacterium]|nr:YfhO family protein [Thermoleophilaceae bacterium]
MRALAALRRRPVLAAALIYAALSLLMVGPALLPGKTLSNSDMFWFQPPWAGVKPASIEMPTNTELGDAPGQLQPFLHLGADNMPGHVPLWDPYIVGGRPFLANAQSQLFSLYALPAYLLPFWTALSWIAVMKLFVASFGMFLLGRALGMRWGGAFTAGLVYAFSLWMVAWISYPHQSVWTFIPWLLLLTDRLVRRPDLLNGAGLAGVMGLQLLSGHPESSFHALVATVAFLALRLWQTKTLRRPLAAFALATAGGFALAALVLIPFGELLWNSADLHDRSGQSIDLQPVSRDFALGLFLPDYWGRATATPIKLFVLDRAFYAGALPLMLAAIALIRRPSVERIAVAAFGALWLAVLFGIPPFLQIVTRLPVFSSGHNSRLSALFILAVALLAGWGLDELTSNGWTERTRRWALAVAGVLLLFPILFVLGTGRTTASVFGDALKVAWGFATPPGATLNWTGGRTCAGNCLPAGDVIRLASVLGWAVVAGAGFALIYLRLRGRIGVTPFVALAALVVAIDLFHAGMGYNPAIDRKVAEQPATESIRRLEADRPNRFVSMEPIPQSAIPFKFRLYEARGYDLPIVRRFDHYWRTQVSPESTSVAKGLLDTPLALREVTPSGLRALRLLGVTQLQQKPQDPPLHVKGVRLAYQGPDARLYRVEGAMPRAFVVGGQHVVGSDTEAFAAVTSPLFDPRAAAVTERRVAGVGDSGSGGDASIVKYEPERVRIRARSNGPGMLVLSDTYYPGWKATVDGHDVPIERVDYLLRGVPLAAGEHTVEFRYQPVSWRIGWIVSLLALIGLAAALVVGRRRRART